MIKALWSATSDQNPHWLIIAGVVVLGFCMQIPAHPFNVSPFGALALVLGAYLPRRGGILAAPVMTLVWTLIFVGLYDLRVLIAVLLGFSLSALMGHVFLAQKRSLPRGILGVGSGALAFYAVSNFGSWLAFYPQTLEGLVTCYINGIPYLWRSFVSDAFFALIFFYAIEFAAAGYRRSTVSDMTS